MQVKTALFTVSPGKTVAGELHIDGGKSLVVLRDTEEVELDSTSGLWIAVSLYEISKATLIHCTPIQRQLQVEWRLARTHPVKFAELVSLRVSNGLSQPLEQHLPVGQQQSQSVGENKSRPSCA